MKKLLNHHYTHALWLLFLANSSARGVAITTSLEATLQEFWEANQAAQVPEEQLPAATLQNLAELAHADDADALNIVKETL